MLSSPEAVKEILDKKSALTSSRPPMPVVSDALSGRVQRGEQGLASLGLVGRTRNKKLYQHVQANYLSGPGSVDVFKV